MKNLENVFKRLDIPYDEEKEKKYILYMEEILEKNKHINLTAITERDEFIKKHYMDSLLCGGSEELLKGERILDLGTGGGFPGIPLAIAFPHKEFVLVDSLNKRVRIINELAEKLKISNAKAIHGRAEELGRRKDFRENFDVCVSRAVANMSTLSEYCLPFVKVGGTFIAYKGPDCDDEIAAAGRAIEELGGKLLREEFTENAGWDLKHRLIYVKKIKNTVSKYPRKAGTPSKEPVK